MGENVNKRIIDTINRSKYNDNVKELLKQLLIFEISRTERSSAFSKEYDKYILLNLEECE